MKLMRYAPIDWLDVVTMQVEGAVSSWVNAVLQDVSASHRPIFWTWAQFKEAMCSNSSPSLKWKKRASNSEHCSIPAESQAMSISSRSYSISFLE